MVEKLDRHNKRSTDMSKSLISIIIPVYNGGSYLKSMLDSIYAQTYSNIEVIVAYDTKSTDASLDILNEYSKKYGLILDMGQDNSSGAARNRGFQLANGEFIIFFDGDDLVAPTYLEELMTVFREHPELNTVCGSFLQAQESNVDKIYRKCISSKNSSIVCGRDEALERWLPAKKYIHSDRLFTAPWTWLVRREYLLRHNIVFPDYSHGDDHLYTGKLIVNSEKIGYTKMKGYVWIMHDTSTLHKYRSYDECYLQEKKFIDDMEILLNENHPDILKRFKVARKIQFDKGYIMRLWHLSFLLNLSRSYRKKILCILDTQNQNHLMPI